MKRTLFPASLVLALSATLGIAQTSTAPPDPSQSVPVQSKHHHGIPDAHHEAAKLSKKLKLTSDQTTKVESILADRDQKLAAVKSNSSLSAEEQKEQTRSILKNTRHQIIGVLTPEQAQQMKSHHKKQDAEPAATPQSGM
jgi:periplasmic protein CpxP/Spy